MSLHLNESCSEGVIYIQVSVTNNDIYAQVYIITLTCPTHSKNIFTLLNNYLKHHTDVTKLQLKKLSKRLKQ